jgi:hypothetical protein
MGARRGSRVIKTPRKLPTKGAANNGHGQAEPDISITLMPWRAIIEACRQSTHGWRSEDQKPGHDCFTEPISI